MNTEEVASFPTNSVAREDLLYSRPDLAVEIIRLSESEIERIANKVGDALQDMYWMALDIALDDYFHQPE